MKIRLLLVAAALFSAASADAETMFDLSQIRNDGIKLTCGEYLSYWEAAEMTGESEQDFALQGAFLGYITGILDGMSVMSDLSSDVIITRFYANCTEQKDELAARVIYQMFSE